MQIRSFRLDKDYSIVEDWAKRNEHWDKFNKQILTDFGYLAYDESNKDIAVAWLYPIQGCKSCMIGFPFTNPDATKDERKAGLDLVFNTIHTVANSMGYELIMTFSSVEPIQKRIKEMGYVEGDVNVTQYFGRLG